MSLTLNKDDHYLCLGFGPRNAAGLYRYEALLWLDGYWPLLQRKDWQKVAGAW